MPSIRSKGQGPAATASGNSLSSAASGKAQLHTGQSLKTTVKLRNGYRHVAIGLGLILYYLQWNYLASLWFGYQAVVVTQDRADKQVYGTCGSQVCWQPANDQCEAQKLYTPAATLLCKGVVPKHGVLLVHGWITAPLVLQKKLPCAKQDRYLWADVRMTNLLVRDFKCWIEHAALNATTGLDPEGIVVQAVEGLDAISAIFNDGIWVWGQLIEALTELGYDGRNMKTINYDWRKSMPLMQFMDGTFSHQQSAIKSLFEHQGQKVVIVSHSHGALQSITYHAWQNEVQALLTWLETVEPGFCEEYVEAWINIAGVSLGVPKAVSALLSGEARDTASLYAAAAAHSFFPREQRVKLFSTWGSTISMLPVGGTAIWGNHTWAPDDEHSIQGAGWTVGSFLTATHSDTGHLKQLNYNIDEALQLLERQLGQQHAVHYQNWGPKHPQDIVSGGNRSQRARPGDKPNYSQLPYMPNPLTTPLPYAPRMKIVCIYGVGVPTERAYHYVTKPGANGEDSWAINGALTDETRQLKNGVYTVDGDGTVPLLSLGLLCADHWRTKALNPSQMRVITRELQHKEGGDSFRRQNQQAADHVDIMGNSQMIEDILRFVTGHDDDIHDQLFSNILGVAAKIKAAQLIETGSSEAKSRS